MELRGRSVLVTGAGTRVGREIALELARRGMRVAVHYNSSRDGAEATAAEIVAMGGPGADVFAADLAAPPACDALVRDVHAAFGTLDALVNSAGVMVRTPIGEVTVEDWDAMFAVNLRAPFFLAQAASRAMGEGSAIVNIADLAAFETWPAYVPHTITKAGVVQMTRALARALAPRTRVNAVAPGVVLLPEGWDESAAERLRGTTPLRRLGTPGDVARSVAYLLEADFVTGETLLVDGGRHIRR